MKEISDPLYTTLPGSIVTSFGIALKKTHTQMKGVLNKLKHDESLKDNLSVDEIIKRVETLWDFDSTDLQKHMVLISDTENAYCPLVTNFIEVFSKDENGNPVSWLEILPLSPSQTKYGILQIADDENLQSRIEYEFLGPDDESRLENNDFVMILEEQ